MARESPESPLQELPALLLADVHAHGGTLTRSPILYLPSEIHNRDWMARLLIADYATALGLTCVVGQQWVVYSNVHNLPPGLILIKTINEIQLTAAKYFKDAGHVVVCMDEEAFPVAPDHEYLGIVLSPRLHEVCDAFYANSPIHAEAMERLLPNMRGKVTATGNPRVDLLASKAVHESQAEAIRKVLGPFVLFNSNAAQENSIWESEAAFLNIQIRGRGLDPNDPKTYADFKQLCEVERVNSRTFMNALRWCLDNLTSHRVVVRPHPVERPGFWAELAEEYHALHVADNKGHIPWLMAADCVVHTNSTTGLEAALLGRPTINLAPASEGNWEDTYVTTRVNPTFKDWRQGMMALAEFLTGQGGPLSELDAQTVQLERYFPSALRGRAAQAIATLMAEAVFPTTGAVEPLKLTHHDRAPATRQKFTKGMEEAIYDFQAARQITGLSHEVQINPLAESCFLVRAA